jgi:hypothetical protein
VYKKEEDLTNHSVRKVFDLFLLCENLMVRYFSDRIAYSECTLSKS